MSTLTHTDTSLGAIRIRCRAETYGRPRASSLERELGAFTDLVVLGWLSTTPTLHMGVPQPRKVPRVRYNLPRRVVYIQEGPDFREVSKAYLLHVVRRDMVRVLRVSFNNPLEGEFTVPEPAKAAGELANAMRQFALIGPDRRAASARAKMLEIDAITAEALHDVTIDEAFHKAERALVALEKDDVDLERAKAELEQQHLQNFKLRLEIAETILKLRRSNPDITTYAGPDSDVSLKDLLEILDSDRAMGSMRVARALNMEVEAEADSD